MSADPVAQGLIANLGQPGKNTTGLSSMGADCSGKQLEIIKESVPGSRIAVLANPDNPGSPYLLHDVQVAAHALQVQLHILAVQSREDLERAFAAIQHEGIGALLILSDPLRLDQFRNDIVAFAMQHRLPAVYPWRMHTEAGGLMSYGPSLPDLHYRAASYVDRILKGAKAADLPVEQPMKLNWSSTSRLRRPRDHVPPDASDPGRRGDPVGRRRGTRVGQTGGVSPVVHGVPTA